MAACSTHKIKDVLNEMSGVHSLWQQQQIYWKHKEQFEHHNEQLEAQSTTTKYEQKVFGKWKKDHRWAKKTSSSSSSSSSTNGVFFLSVWHKILWMYERETVGSSLWPANNYDCYIVRYSIILRHPFDNNAKNVFARILVLCFKTNTK